MEALQWIKRISQWVGAVDARAVGRHGRVF